MEAGAVVAAGAEAGASLDALACKEERLELVVVPPIELPLFTPTAIMSTAGSKS